MKKNVAWSLLALLIMIAIYLMNLWLSHPFKAAEKGRLDIVRFHIWLGGDINDSTRFRMSSEKTNISFLHYAAMGGQIEIMQWLLKHGAALDARTKLKSRTSLHYAANDAEYLAVKLLLESGADINARDKSGETPLLLAIDRQRLTDGNNIKRYIKPGYRERTIEILLTNGADPLIRNNYGKTSIMAAANQRNLQLMNQLLAYGVDINAKTTENTPKTAVDYLLNSNVYDANRDREELIVFNWLLENISQEARIELQSKKLLHGNCNPKILEILIRNKFDVNDRNHKRNNMTPLHSALVNTHCKIDVLKALVNAGADLNSRTNEGKTVLHYAVASFNPDKLMFILDKITNIEIRDNRGNTAIHELTNVNKVMLDALLVNGLDINAKNNSGQTLLHKLVSIKQKNCNRIESLLTAGIDPMIRNNEGRTALDIVKDSSYMKLNSKAESCLRKYTKTQ